MNKIYIVLVVFIFQVGVTATLAGMKLDGAIDWTWFWVASPFWSMWSVLIAAAVWAVLRVARR